MKSHIWGWWMSVWIRGGARGGLRGLKHSEMFSEKPRMFLWPCPVRIIITEFSCALKWWTAVYSRQELPTEDRGQVSRHLWKRGQASRRQKFDARLFHELRYGYLERTKSIETPVFQRFSSNLPTNTSNLLKNYVYMRYFTKYSYFTFKDILQ